MEINKAIGTINDASWLVKAWYVIGALAAGIVAGKLFATDAGYGGDSFSWGAFFLGILGWLLVNVPVVAGFGAFRAYATAELAAYQSTVEAEAE